MYIGPVDKSVVRYGLLDEGQDHGQDISFFSSALMKIVDEIGERAGQSCAQQHSSKSSTTSKIHIDIGVDG
jgi:hypothetical protein